MSTKTHITKTEENQVEKAVQIRSDDPGSPVSNQTWINTTDKKMKFYDGSDIQNVGAAGVGSASTFALFQAEDGDISSFTNMAIESASPIAGDKSYSISSLPATAPSISVDERRAGSTCVVSLMSRLTSGSGKIVVKDNSSNVLESLIVSGTSAEKVVIDFGIPAAATSIQISFEDESSATGWVVDDIEFTDNPWVYGNLLDEQQYEISQVASSMTSANSEIQFNLATATIVNNGDALIVAEDDSGNNRTKFVAQRNGIKVDYAWTTRLDSIREATVLKNGTFIMIGDTCRTSTDMAHVSGTVYLDAGDYLTFASASIGTPSGNLTSTYNNKVFINSRIESEHVVTPAKATTETYRMFWTPDFWDTTAPTSNFDITLFPLTDSKLLEYNDTTETRIVAKQDCTISVTIAGQLVNDSELDVKDQNGNLICRNTARTDQTTSTGVSAEVLLNKGEYIVMSKGNSINRTASFNLIARPREATFLAAVPKNYFQKKNLSADTTLTGVLSDLTFNNLVVGKTYRADFMFYFTKVTGITNDMNFEVDVDNGSTHLCRLKRTFSAIADTVVTKSGSVTFVATDTTLTFTATTLTRTQINASSSNLTYAVLEELNYTEETTRFS